MEQRHTCLAKCLQCLPPVATTCQNSALNLAIHDSDLTRLLSAIEKSKPKGISRICYPDVNQPLDGTEGTATHLAASSASPEILKALIARGASVNVLDSKKRSPLHIAARRGEPLVVEALLASVVQIDRVDGDGRTPLQIAVEHGFTECAALLVAHGAQPEAMSLGEGPGVGAATAKLGMAAETLAVVDHLWRPPAIRFAAICRRTAKDSQRIAEFMHGALVADARDEYRRLLRRVLSSERLQQHHDLTVSTDVGMMHYKLENACGLLFLVVTYPDFPQSSAFSFLCQLRNRFFADNPQALSLPTGAPFHVGEKQAIALLREVCTGESLPDVPPGAQGRLPKPPAALMKQARSLGLASLAPGALSSGGARDARRRTRNDSTASGGNGGGGGGGGGSSVYGSSRRKEEEGTPHTPREVEAHLHGQVDRLRAQVEGLPRPHAIALLRRHGWSCSLAMQALAEQPNLVPEMFGPRWNAPAEASADAAPIAAAPSAAVADEAGGKGGVPAAAMDTNGAVAQGTAAAAGAPVDGPAAAAAAGPAQARESFSGARESVLRAHLRARVLEGAVPLCYPLASSKDSGKGTLVEPVAEVILEKLLPSEMRAEYEATIVRTFLAESPNWQACPTVCGNAVHVAQAPLAPTAAKAHPAAPPRSRKLSADDSTNDGGAASSVGTMAFDVTCSCGARFCWHCKRECHAPLPCSMISGWQMACEEAGDGATAADRPDGGAAASELDAARVRVEALARASARERRTRDTLVQLNELLTGMLLNVGGRYSPDVLEAAEVLFEARRSLRVVAIAAYMLKWTVGHVAPHAPAYEGRRAAAHEALPLLSQRLELLTEMLSTLLEVDVLTSSEATPNGAADLHAKDVPKVRNADHGGDNGAEFELAPTGTRAIILVKQAKLLRTGDAKMVWCGLATLTQATEVVLQQLNQSVLLLVRPDSALQHPSGADSGLSSMGTMIESFVPNILPTLWSAWTGGTGYAQRPRLPSAETH